jgi:hypothetical protein
MAGMRHAGVMPELPTPFRAALGLLATAADEARRLPDHALEWPMLAVSTALQFSLRAQQRYAELAARGDELIRARQPVSDEPPPWATFDDDPAPEADDVRSPTSDAGDDGAAAGSTTPIHRPRHIPPSRFDAVGDDFATADDSALDPDRDLGDVPDEGQ